MADGRTLSWSHLVSLAGVSAGRLYDRLLEQALSQSWTVRQLEAALDEAGIAVPVPVSDGSD
jgi:hypothetical protein